jgi:hypothetical protein
VGASAPLQRFERLGPLKRHRLIDARHEAVRLIVCMPGPRRGGSLPPCEDGAVHDTNARETDLVA